MGRERRKWEHTLPRFPFHCYTNPYPDARIEAHKEGYLFYASPPPVPKTKLLSK